MLPDHTLPSSLREVSKLLLEPLFCLAPPFFPTNADTLGQFMLPQYTFKPFPPWKLDYVNHVILRDLNKNMGILLP
jgi:hypothetical protein